MSANKRILFSGVLRPNLLNNLFASCSFLNPHFLLPHKAHFDDNIVLPFLVFKALSPHFLLIFCTLNNVGVSFTMVCIWKA